jgi:hypothetical protein
VEARQLRGDASGRPVGAWGRSNDTAKFEVEMTATHPAGRGRAKLEVETCPPGVPFGDASCATQVGATWSDVRALPWGVVLNEAVTGLVTDNLYRWRARVLHAPYTVTQAGITPPPNPAHGPWRRLSAQATEADIRTLLAAPDLDDDEISDVADNCIGVYNRAQDDTDGDGCGNACDADYNNSGRVGMADFNELRSAWGEMDDDEKCHFEPIPGCTVGFPELFFFADHFLGTPGPSGTTAGTTACP